MRASSRRDLDRVEIPVLPLDVHGKIAADVYPKGARLACGCGNEQHATTEQVAEYLRSGWPTHCGGLIMIASAR